MYRIPLSVPGRTSWTDNLTGLHATCKKKNSSFFLFKLNIFFALTAAAVAQREKARTPFFAAAQCTQRKSWSVCHATHETDLSHVAQAKSRG